MKQRGTDRDRGATLLIVLVIITMVSVVTGVILTQADTSVRTTLTLRDQSSGNYAVDGAVDAAIAQIKTGQLSCSSLSTNYSNLGSSAQPFYRPAQTTDGPINARVNCSPDASAGAGTATSTAYATSTTTATATNTTTTTGLGQTISASNDPDYALLTVGTGAGEGQNYTGNQTVCINGGKVRSNSFISLGTQSGSKLSVGLSTATSGACGVTADSSVSVSSAGATGCNNAAANADPTQFGPTACTHDAAPMGVSTWAAMSDAPSTAAVPLNPNGLCYSSGGTTYAALRPGIYTGALTSTTAMNLAHPCPSANGTTFSAADYIWLTPGSTSVRSTTNPTGGTYYFNYGSTAWNWPTNVLGGTPTASTGRIIANLYQFDVTNTAAANVSALGGLSQAFPGACANPAQLFDASGTPASTGYSYPGVEMVFGGASTFAPSTAIINGSEICATYSSTNKPTAIYGISSDVYGSGVTVGSTTVPAETLCAATPCTYQSTGGNSLMSVTNPNGKPQFYLQGYVYAPSASITSVMKTSTGQVFSWGMVLRSFTMTVNGVSSSAPFVVLRPQYSVGQVPITTTTTATTTATATTTTVTTTPVYTIRYVNVWTCPAGSTPCATNGPANAVVRIKLDLTQPVASQSVQVLAYSHRR